MVKGMTWIDDMKADALALAHPGFKLQDGDEIHVDVISRADGRLSSVTFEPGFATVDVDVWRPVDLDLTDRGPNGELVFRWLPTGQCYVKVTERRYINEEIQPFFVALMNRGSQEAKASPLPAVPGPARH